MSAPLINTHPDAFRLKQSNRSFFWRFDGATLYLLRTALNDPNGSWDAARPLYVNADSGQVFLGPDTIVNGTFYVGRAKIATNGDINGTAWGGWLNDWINNNFVRDVRMGMNQSGIIWGPQGGTLPAGFVLTGGNFDDDREWPVYAPVQKYVNGTWYNVGRE
ncbi:hypothetical protein GTL21_005159 [Salmonella enterica]|nr:hypothetical protein [Salmonella enterica]